MPMPPPTLSLPVLGRLLLVCAGLALLGGCASRSGGASAGAAAGRDGLHPNPPAGLERTPDAIPRVEPIRVGGPNKPYEAAGRSYQPFTQDLALREQGLASWYGRLYHGRPTSSGEPYDMFAMTAAHPTMPIPSYARVRNPANAREVIVRINDRGPFVPGRVVDLSYTAALKLDLLRGVAPVVVERITFDDIRSGRWRAAGAATMASDPAGEEVRARALLP
jgi:rare lipoprotein A